MEAPRISVVGLGYVGLPLAVALARHFPVVGYDRDDARVAALREGHDATGEVASADLGASRAAFTDAAADMRGSDLFIVAVPTPVGDGNVPDLSAVLEASATVGGVLAPGAVVVLESTVYPGVTEEICGPAIAGASRLVQGRDFFLGYSPERINPGDPAHGLGDVTKVVAGDTPAVVDLLTKVYGAATGGNLFVARDIRTAEAAKVIENAQRDINIAFVNEIAMIFDRMGLSTGDVLAAARTKWNFLDFRPGLVGGHCIGVDPYYLAAAARAAGHDPEIVLAGRRINDRMAHYVAEAVLSRLPSPAGARILVLGLTFKEDVPDLRNTGVAPLIARLKERGASVDVHDPLADPVAAKRHYDIDLLPDLSLDRPADAVIGAVAHGVYRKLDAANLSALVARDGLVADLKGLWRDLVLPSSVRRWAL